MKQILEKSIVNIDENIFDNKFLFSIPSEANYDGEIDMSTLLLAAKNENLNYKKDYKLWSEVYSPKEELRIFSEFFEKALETGKKVHISNISLAEEIEMIKSLYLELGYFNAELNCFQVDFINSPVTIGVNINNIIYSFKDYKQLKEKILFVPPPREPRHQKTIKSAINSGIISSILLNNPEKEKRYIESIIKEEKTSLTRLAKCLYFNLVKRGFKCKSQELVVKI